MKILAFADIHGNLSAIKKLKKKAKKADIVLCAGDLSIFEQALDHLVLKISKIEKPVLIIHGNHESQRETRLLTDLFERTIFLHKKDYTKENVLVLGYGGGGFSHDDPEFSKLSKKFSRLIKKHRKDHKNAKIVLMTHAPPYETKLDLIIDEHCGNKDIKKFILKEKIELVIAGHIHETAGADYSSKGTRYVNPGPFGKVLDI